MRTVIIKKPQKVAPFNEAASELRVLNKPLWQWQRDLLAPFTDEKIEVNDFDSIPGDPVETLVYSNNLWFDQAFFDMFITEARSRGKAVRAAFRADDPAFLQQGLWQLTRSYERRGDLFYVDLWYFPEGIARQIEPVIITSDSAEIGYYSMPNYMSGQANDLVWWLPDRAVCVVDTWVHVFFINIVFGIFTEAFRSEKRSSSDAMFRLQASLRSLIERKSVLESSTYVKIGENCSIDDSTVFQGPVQIGNNVTIGPGCVITQSIIGNNVTLTHGNHLHMSVISDSCFFPWGASAYFSVFMENSSAGNNACLDMSVVGRNTYIGSGTIFTDFNLLPTPLTITGDDLEAIEIDMPVLGVCVGHNCRVGSGLVVYPAKMIESDVVLIPSPNRRVIMNDIWYEQSDHHATLNADLHPRRYPRD